MKNKETIYTISSTRLSFLCAVAFLLIIACVSIQKEASTASQPNILIITLDTTRADHLPCYKYPHPTMPFLCSIAQAQGTLYEKAFTTAPITFPAHVSLFTGLEPQKHLMLDNGLFKMGTEQETLAKILKKTGYSTYAYISAAILDRIYGLDAGFDLYDDNIRMGKREFFNYKERAASQVVDTVLRNLDSWKKPYFAWIHFYDPHDPYLPPPPYDKQFKNPYDGEIAFVDAQIKRLFEVLKSKNKWQQTSDWAFILGDHGEDLGDFNEIRHGILITPATIEIPLIVLSPGASGKRISNVVSITDVAPTILNLLNLWDEKAKSKMNGTPLTSAPLKRSPIMITTMMPFFSFRWSPLIGELDYPRLFIKGSKNELFNIETDPKMKTKLNDKDKQVFTSLNNSLEKIKKQLITKMNPSVQNNERREQMIALGYTGTVSKNMPKDPFIMPDARDKVYIYKQFLESKHFVTEGKWNEALDKFSSLAKADPSNTLLLNNLATIYENMGDIKKSEDILLKVKDLIPDMDYPYLDLGEFYVRQNKLDEAEKYFKIGLQKNKRYVDIFNALFQMAINQQNMDKAYEILKQAQNNGVKDIEMSIFYAILSRNKGMWQDAFNALKDAELLDPTDERIAIEKVNVTCKPATTIKDKCIPTLQSLNSEIKKAAEIWAAAAEWYSAKKQYPQSLYCWLEASKRPASHPLLPRIIPQNIQLLQSQSITPEAPDWAK